MALIRSYATDEFLIGVGAGFIALLAILAFRGRIDWAAGWVGASIYGLAQNESFRTSVTTLVRESPSVIAGSIATGAVVVAVIHRRRDDPTTLLAWAVSVGGVWATVPDTEEVAVLLGVTSVLIWLVWPLRLARLSSLTIIGLPVLLLAAGWVGSAGMPTAILGTLGSLAAIALLDQPPGPRSARRDLLFHFAFVLIWSRIVRQTDSTVAAIVVGAALTTAVFGLKLMTVPVMDNDDEHRTRPS